MRTHIFSTFRAREQSNVHRHDLRKIKSQKCQKVLAKSRKYSVIFFANHYRTTHTASSNLQVNIMNKDYVPNLKIQGTEAKGRGFLLLPI